MKTKIIYLNPDNSNVEIQESDITYPRFYELHPPPHTPTVCFFAQNKGDDEALLKLCKMITVQNLNELCLDEYRHHLALLVGKLPDGIDERIKFHQKHSPV